MRIALTTETFLPKIDGIVNTLCYLLEHLQRRGWETLLFAPSGCVDHFANTRVVPLPARPFPLYPEQKVAWPFADISHHLKAFRPDLVHLLNPFAVGVAGLRHARRLGLPIVASYHTDIPGFLTRWGYRSLCPLAWAYLRWLHNQAALNLAPSSITCRELEEQGIRRVRMWSRGVDTQRFHPCHRDLQMRMRLSGGQPEKNLLLYAGRLAPEKQVETLLPVLQSRPDLCLALVGDGPARDKLKSLFAGTSTVFTGYLRGPELSQAYASADCFVFPSTTDTFGNVVLEAMASGLPVVAAAAGGPLDQIENGSNGLLFKPHDSADLGKQIDWLFDRPDRVRDMGKAGRRHAESRSWSVVFDRLLDDYVAVAGKRRDPRVHDHAVQSRLVRG